MTQYYKYHNLLLFNTDAASAVIVGEDKTASMTVNEALADKDATETAMYNATIGAIQSLSVQYTDISRLPPGTLFTSLLNMDISNCSKLTEIPSTYSSGLLSLKASSTKLSSIPNVYNSLTYLDCSNCKRIASIGISTLETLLMSHSAVTEITNSSSLVRLIALNSKVTEIPSSPDLVVLMWSLSTSLNDTKLTIHPDCTKVVHVITSGPSTAIHPIGNGLVTSILL